jgi:hypothetical protein
MSSFNLNKEQREILRIQSFNNKNKLEKNYRDIFSLQNKKKHQLLNRKRCNIDNNKDYSDGYDSVFSVSFLFIYIYFFKILSVLVSQSADISEDKLFGILHSLRVRVSESIFIYIFNCFF